MNERMNEYTLPGIGLFVWLHRPDGGTVNALEPWRITDIRQEGGRLLAVFTGRPYQTWPLEFCRAARLVSFPSDRRGTASGVGDILRVGDIKD
jgi:hypothetical protein